MPFSGYQDLNPGFSAKLQALVAASGGRVWVNSGFRSVSRQQELYAAGMKKWGNAVRKWVAPPGKSNHNHGIAADLGGDLKLAAALAPRFGLHFPMDHEPWHIEPGGKEAATDPEAYTEPPDGFKPEAQKRTLQDHLASLEAMILAPDGAGDLSDLPDFSGAGDHTGHGHDGGPGAMAQGGDALAKFMAAVKQRESSGNYKAVGQPTKYGTASGAYQWLDSTWAGYAGYARAADAPPEVQDRRAREDMQRLSGQYGGDWKQVAMHWHGGPNKGIWGPKTRSYADQVVGMMS